MSDTMSSNLNRALEIAQIQGRADDLVGRRFRFFADISEDFIPAPGEYVGEAEIPETDLEVLEPDIDYSFEHLGEVIETTGFIQSISYDHLHHMLSFTIPTIEVGGLVVNTITFDPIEGKWSIGPYEVDSHPSIFKVL